MITAQKLSEYTYRQRDSFKDFDELVELANRMVAAGMSEDDACDVVIKIYANAANDYGD